MSRVSLNNNDIAALKTFVSASVDAQIVDARTRGDTYLLASLLNATNVPATPAWMVAASAQTIDGGVSSYTGYDSLTQGKRDEWSIFLQYAPRDMSDAKKQNVVKDVWGNITSGSVGESVLLACQEPATVAQVVIGGNTNGSGTVTGLARRYAGQVTQEECQKILA